MGCHEYENLMKWNEMQTSISFSYNSRDSNCSILSVLFCHSARYVFSVFAVHSRLKKSVEKCNLGKSLIVLSALKTKIAHCLFFISWNFHIHNGSHFPLKIAWIFWHQSRSPQLQFIVGLFFHFHLLVSVGLVWTLIYKL